MNIDAYFSEFGQFHAQKTHELLEPLHVPDRDAPLDFSELTRQPFPAQAHVVTAAVHALAAKGRVITAAEMGCGKTILAIATIHKHAQRSYRKGGYRGNYRAIVLCPDHLISKWKEEILATVPGSTVTTFDAEGDGCKQLIKDEIAMYDAIRDPTRPGHWKRPTGPTWFILGRNQAKYMPTKSPVGEAKYCFDGKRRGKQSSRKKLTWVEDKKSGIVTKQAVISAVYQCPKCGAVVKNKKGLALNLAKEPRTFSCEAKYAVEVYADGRQGTGFDISFNQEALAQFKPGAYVDRHDRRYKVVECGEPLWHYTPQPRRWAPAKFISDKMRGAFPYLVVDEVHEQKSQTAAQANACAKLIGSSRYCIALTGTLIGGYARDLFYLLFRMDPQPLVDAGMTWSSVMQFTRAYGKIEKTTTTTVAADGRTYTSRSRRSMAKDDEQQKETERPAPGIMPALFGHHLIDKSIFLALEDMSDNLPSITEYVGGPPLDHYSEEDNYFYVDCTVEMELDQKNEYVRVERAMVNACKDLLQNSSMKLLGAMLATTMDYPDKPWDWKAPPEIQVPFDQAIASGRIAKDTTPPVACGYWGMPGAENRVVKNWVPVVQPKSLRQDVLYPKEEKLLEIVRNEVKAGNQVWVYVQMTGKRDVQPRLQSMLRKHGYKCEILRADTVKPRDRLDWIAKHGPRNQVIISHPELVSTGVDFFRKDHVTGDFFHNFNAIVFYQSGYKTTTTRQASRRAWRIGQNKSCRVYILHYAETMQARALGLIAKKLAAMTQLDGELTAEGLASLADDGSEAMALARSISDNISESDIHRNWAKLGGHAAKKPSVFVPQPEAMVPNDALLQLGLQLLEDEKDRDILELPDAHALVAETILEHDVTLDRGRLSELFRQFSGLDCLDPV